jgi:isoleucyl-tRNA synthetase
MIYREAGAAGLGEELLALVQDELNVKQVQFVDEPSDLVVYGLLPDNKVLGPRFGKRFPALRATLSDLDPLDAVRRLRAGLPLQLEVEGEEVELSPEEVLVHENAREGLAVASERGVTVAVDVVVTSELAAEGMAREVVRRIQNLRKEAGLNLDDRIVTGYQAEGELAVAIGVWRDFIAAETLSVELEDGLPDEGGFTGEDRIDGDLVRFSIRTV